MPTFDLEFDVEVAISLGFDYFSNSFCTFFDFLKKNLVFVWKIIIEISVGILLKVSVDIFISKLV